MNFKEIRLPKNSSPEKSRLITFLKKYIGREFSNISRPCYYLKMVRTWRDIVYLTGIDKTIIKEFKKGIPHKYKSRHILYDDATMLLLYAIISSFNQKENENARLLFYMLSLKFYGSLIHRYFKSFCNPEIWNIALDRLSTKHIFRKLNGIANAIIYLSDNECKKYKERFQKIENTEDGWDFCNSLVYSLRTRINQSVKSFANKYYKLSQDEKLKVKAQGEEEDIEQTPSVADRISIKISTYSQINKQAIIYASEKSGARIDLSTYIIEQMSQVSTREKLRFILTLMNRVVPLDQICNNRSKNNLIRKVSVGAKIGRYVIRDKIIEMLEEVDKDYIIKTSNKKQVVSFFLHYITFYIQRSIC